MANAAPSAGSSGKKFIGIHFVGCNTYVRLYPNKQRSHFEGRCVRCGKPVRLRIGPEGFSDHFFQAPCMMNRNDNPF